MFRHNAMLSEAIRLSKRARKLLALENSCLARGMRNEAARLATERARVEQQALALVEAPFTTAPGPWAVKVAT